MKKPIPPLSQCALLVACLMAGMAHAQSINLTGDTDPTGNLGGSHSGAAMMVGNTGTGGLDILGGAVLNNSGTTNVGNSAGSTGTVRMSGASQWNASAMYVGRAGTGTLTVNQGAKLVSTEGHIGQELGSFGTVNLDGAGTSWTIPASANGDLVVGNNGAQARLFISNGATASVPKDLYASFSPAGTPWNPYVGSLISISDANSALAVNGLCSLGSPNPLSVSILDGGNMQCGGAASLTRGEISVQRAGSHFSVGSNLDIGTEAANSEGSIGIGQQASVDVAGDLLLPNVTNPRVLTKGTLNISGYDTPGVLNAQRVVFGANGQGMINFSHVDTSGNYVFASSITGPGKVDIVTQSDTTFSGNNDYTGQTIMRSSSTVRAGSDTGLSRGSDFLVIAGATLDTATYNPSIAGVSNNGVINMLAGGTSTVLTAGVYGGGFGTIRMNTALGDSNSPTQRLVVTNNASPGDTILDITNLGGVGAPTNGNGILVVQVDGISDHTFSLPAPGYLQVGEFRYDLLKIGNNWYLQNEARAEVTGPEISVACSPSELTAPNQVATCTVSLSGASASDLSVNLNLPATNARYTTTCTSPIVVPANATQASCTITSVGGSGDATAELSIAAPSTPDAYSVGGAPSLVLIKDGSGGDNGGGDNGGGDNGGGDNGGGDNGGGDNGGGDSGSGGGVTPHKVPTIGTLGLVSMASIMGLIGLRRTRQSRQPRTPGQSA